jgi:hypothetical protein
MTYSPATQIYFCRELYRCSRVLHKGCLHPQASYDRKWIRSVIHRDCESSLLLFEEVHHVQCDFRPDQDHVAIDAADVSPSNPKILNPIQWACLSMLPGSSLELDSSRLNSLSSIILSAGPITRELAWS